MVKIVWYGHACFEVSTPEICLVTDPHDGKGLGIPPPDVKADILLEGHDHWDHVDGEAVVSKGEGKTYVLRSYVGKREIAGITINGIKTFHDGSYGEKRGENVVYTFTLGGITFCHLGDLGHLLTHEQLREIGTVNVLFVPVGGTYTVDSIDASKIVNQVEPNIAIPMHYRFRGLKAEDIDTVDGFLQGKENVETLESSRVEIARDNLPPKTKILVFRPPSTG